MRTTTHAGALLLAFAGSLMAAAQEPDPLALPGKPAAPAFQLKDALIEKAVRETIAESREQDKGKAQAALSGGVLSGDRYEAFGRQFSEAQKPSCLGPDALKHQPAGMTYKGWNFGLGGLLALPFWGAAIVRGKCR